MIRTPAGAVRARPTPPEQGDAAGHRLGIAARRLVDAVPRRPTSSTCAVAPDAIVDLAGWAVPAARCSTARRRSDPAGRRSIEVLPAPEIPVEVELVDAATGEPDARHASGSPPPTVATCHPMSHRDEVNPGFYEDTGADLVLGAIDATPTSRAASRSGCRPAAVEVEAVAGFDRRPIRTDCRDRSDRPAVSSSPLERALDLHGGRWVTADSHVHFVAAVDGPAPGGRRGRRPGQPARDPVGRPLHERDRPALGLDGRPVRTPARRRRHGEPPERPRPPRPPRRPPADPADGQRRPARGTDGQARSTSCSPTGRTAAVLPAGS